MSLSDDLLDAAKTAAITQARVTIDRQKSSFFEKLTSIVTIDEAKRMADLWDRAVQAKANAFMATDAAEADEQNDVYDMCIDSVRELGVGLAGVGQAKASVFAHDLMHEVIGGGFAIAGQVMQTALGILFPGVGSLVGAGLNIGLQKVVAHFNKE